MGKSVFFSSFATRFSVSLGKKILNFLAHKIEKRKTTPNLRQDVYYVYKQPQKNWACTNVRWVVVFVGKNQCWVVLTFSLRTFKVSSPILRGFHIR